MKLISKILNWVKITVESVKKFISSGSLDDKLVQVVGIVNVIKQFADSPITIIVVKATPFTWDDQARLFLSELLGSIKQKYGSLKTTPALKEIAGNLAQKETGLPFETASFKVEEAYQISKLGV